MSQNDFSHIVKLYHENDFSQLYTIFIFLGVSAIILLRATLMVFDTL